VGPTQQTAQQKFTDDQRGMMAAMWMKANPLEAGRPLSDDSNAPPRGGALDTREHPTQHAAQQMFNTIRKKVEALAGCPKQYSKT